MIAGSAGRGKVGGAADEERTRWYATRAANYGLERVMDTGWSRRVRLSTECQRAYLPLPANAKGSRPMELLNGV